MIARAILVVVIGVLLAAQIVRTAVVTDDSARAEFAPRLWSSHPAVIIDRTMTEIGGRAAHGRSLTPEILRQVEQIAREEPLAPEPFLIKGALAQVEQRQELAEQLFTAARARDPRSVAARYFLADRYLRSGRTPQALDEIAVLSRLFPQGRASFGPALAAFAKTPGAVPQLRSFFHASPELEPLVLTTLADDANNANLILALWKGRGSGTNVETAAWQSKLVNKLVEQGAFAKAYSTWRRIAGVNDGQGTVFNPGFIKSIVPPPFNWSFAGVGGLVEPAAGDRLHVIYFGRADTVLAEQQLLLAPGRYQLSMDISNPPGEGGEIAWSLTCNPGTDAIFRLPIKQKGSLAGSFAVPQGCGAQRLQLTGSAGDFAQSQDLTIGKFSLTKAAGA